MDRIVNYRSDRAPGFERYDDFFKFAYNAMPADGADAAAPVYRLYGRGHRARIPLTMEMAKFIRFIVTDIFLLGRLPTIDDRRACRRRPVSLPISSPQPHFARTLT